MPLGDLDISFYRDDVNAREPGDGPVVHASHLDFDLDGRTVVLVDDVLFTGRTVRAAIDALFDYGRPERVQLAVLVDRGHRELPIRPDYVGKNLPTSREERVYVRVEELDEVDEVAIAAHGVEARPMRHLLAIADLERADIERITDRAEGFAEVGRRDIKKVPTLRGRTIINLFYESSTRTSSSFELAAKRLSADVVSVKAAGSSVDKGESLKDTIATLGAYGPEAIVIRSPHAGAAELVARWTEAAVINAGDGKHEHPSQALLDVYTLRQRLGSLEGKRIWIVGDVLHSRVARSNVLAFGAMGAEVTVCGPPTLIPRGFEEALGCAVAYDLDDLGEADVVYALRMQRERMRESFVPSIREYAARYQIDSRRLGPRQLLMHPGPVNRGVELSPGGDRRPQLADRRAGRERAGGADGDPLRAAGRRRPRPGGGRAGDPDELPGADADQGAGVSDSTSIASLDWRGATPGPRATWCCGGPRCSTRGPASTAPTTSSCGVARSPSWRTREAPSREPGRGAEVELIEAEGKTVFPAFFDPMFTCARPATRTRRTSRPAPVPRRRGLLRDPGDGEYPAAVQTAADIRPCASAPPRRPPSRRVLACVTRGMAGRS